MYEHVVSALLSGYTGRCQLGRSSLAHLVSSKKPTTESRKPSTLAFQAVRTYV